MRNIKKKLLVASLLLLTVDMLPLEINATGQYYAEETIFEIETVENAEKTNTIENTYEEIVE